MSEKILALDVGNTDIEVGIFLDGHLTVTFRIATAQKRTSDEYALLFSSIASQKGHSLSDLSGAVIGSVVPSVTKAVREAISYLCADVPVLTVGPGVKTGFPIRLSNPSELGADLAANAAGAIHEIGAPVMMIDLGSATTVTAVCTDGSFAGGSILPGVQMSFDALCGAELLPGVTAERTVPPIGKNTEDCIRTGVLRGTSMAIKGFCALYQKNLSLPEGTPVVVTGTFAPYLLPLLPKEYLHLPHLTLLGLYEIYRLNKPDAAKRR